MKQSLCSGGKNAVWLLALALCAGCRSRSGHEHEVGGDLPVTSANSVALPGATDAADTKHAPQVAESQNATLTAYKDPTTGVIFNFPTVWRPSQGTVLPEPEVSSVAGKPRVTEEFLPAGNLYQATVLRSLMFSYGVARGVLSASQCAALPGKSSANAGSAKHVTYNGAQYTEVAGGDAAACTQVASQIDSTLQNGKCLVFERDFVTSCPLVQSQTRPRPLTNAEQAALQRHLDAVMDSVRITP